MPIINIPAHEIDLGDVLGEGMRVWITVKDKERVTIHWGPEGTSLMLTPEYLDNVHRIDYKPNDIVRVIRG